MGNVLAKSKKKKKGDKKHKLLRPLQPLSFYETSMEDWTFGKKHVDAICDSLQRLHLQMMEELILEYLGKTKESNSPFIGWDHPNYTTFIHTKNTPLDDEFKPKKVISETQSALTEYKVMVMGARGVGKSNLLFRFACNTFVGEYDPTIEDSYRRQCALAVSKTDYDKSADVDGTDKVLFDILDTAGREEFSAYHDLFIKESQMFILVFSVVYKESFEEIQMIRERILRVKEKDDYPIIAVGNKCDLRVDGKVCDGYGGRSGSEVNMDKVHEWCEKFQIPYIETSAKEGKNVHLLFRQCVYEYRAWLE